MPTQRVKTAKPQGHTGKDKARGTAKPEPSRPPGSAGRTRARTRGHALLDDIGTPMTPEQEAYGGAGDLGTTGAVDRDVSRSGTVGVSRPRNQPGARTRAEALARGAAERRNIAATQRRNREQETGDEDTQPTRRTRGTRGKQGDATQRSR
jgi:hypothetical protein